MKKLNILNEAKGDKDKDHQMIRPSYDSNALENKSDFRLDLKSVIL